jgi:hypothetical protein
LVLQRRSGVGHLLFRRAVSRGCRGSGSGCCLRVSRDAIERLRSPRCSGGPCESKQGRCRAGEPAGSMAGNAGPTPPASRPGRQLRRERGSSTLA